MSRQGRVTWSADKVHTAYFEFYEDERGGYDKGEQPKPRHQNRQIEIAPKRLKEWEARSKK